jgi:hypothetical protein
MAFVASDDVRITPVGAGRRYDLIGDIHAVREGESITLCRREDVHFVPEMAWPREHVARECDACARAVHEDVPAIEYSDPPPGWPGGPRER